MAAALLVSLFLGVMLLGGEFSLNRFIDSVNTDDPTTGRAHFWSVTLEHNQSASVRRHGTRRLWCDLHAV